MLRTGRPARFRGVRRNGSRTARETVVVGGGLAAQRFCETLRRLGYDGPIRMDPRRAGAPYTGRRCPKSSSPASSSPTPSTCVRPSGTRTMRSSSHSAGQQRPSIWPCARDPGGRRLAGFERLLIATGAQPRLLPGLGGFGNVSHAADSAGHACPAELDRCRRPNPAIVGAGFIGLKVAATARRLGAEVTLIEAARAPLAGVLGPDAGGMVRAAPS